MRICPSMQSVRVGSLNVQNEYSKASRRNVGKVGWNRGHGSSRISEVFLWVFRTIFLLTFL